MFSRIVSKLHSESNVLYKTRDELKSQGAEIRDLVSGNINEHGFVFPQELLEKVLWGKAFSGKAFPGAVKGDGKPMKSG